MATRILLAEDEALIGRMVELNLCAEGFAVDWVLDGEAARQRALGERFDLLLLDLGLPGRSGFSVAKSLRDAEVTVPILMLTARSDPASKVRGLDAGADDYLTKPFEMAELLARVRALVRRSQGVRHLPSASRLQLGRCEVNLETREATTQVGKVQLSEKETRLLRLFARHRGQTLSRQDILDEVWGLEKDPTERTVDNVIVRLRRYFEANPSVPEHIESVRGEGYRFVA